MIISAELNPLHRRVFGVAALAALVLTACASDEQAAGFEDAEAASAEGGTDETVEEESESELPQVESGFFHEQLSNAPTVVDSQRPEQGEVITPVGTLSIDEIESIESVSAEEVGLDPVYQDEGATDAETLDYVPAEGEVFRVLNLSFTSHQDAAHSATSTMALNVDGAQTHLHDLDSQQEHRLLVSVPEDGSTRLVVSSEGHDQYVDVLTGEREDDDVAAAYYRDVVQQDPNHKYPIDSGRLGVEREAMYQTSGEEDDMVLNYDFGVSSVRLAAWTEEGGWADPGEAWLVVDRSYEVETEWPPMFGELEEVKMTFTTEVGDEATEEDHYDDGGIRNTAGELTTYTSVPNDMTEVALSLNGSATVEIPSGVGRGYFYSEGGTHEFTSEPLEVSFPDENSGSVEGEASEDEHNEE